MPPPERPALYFTVLGESAIKMLRYQQQYSFFDPAKLPDSIRFINLSQVVLEKDMGAVWMRLQKKLKRPTRRRGCRLLPNHGTEATERYGPAILHSAVSPVSGQLASDDFLIGEYAEDELRDNPIIYRRRWTVLAAATAERNSIVRKLQVIKLRGQDPCRGCTHSASPKRVQAFSRTFGLTARKRNPPSDRRLFLGIAELDKMLGGGVREGDSVLVAGSSGTGKSVLATQFMAEGSTPGGAGNSAVFEERPQAYAERAASLGLDLETPQKDGKLTILILRP